MIHRIDIRPTQADSAAQSLTQQIKKLFPHAGPVTLSRIFLIETQSLTADFLPIAKNLLADPIVEQAEWISTPPPDTHTSRIEVHLKPGVMDPVAASTEMALRDRGIAVTQVRTGKACLIEGKLPQPDLQKIAQQFLANGVIEAVHFSAYLPQQFETGHTTPFQLKHINLLNLTDAQLTTLSRDAHLFLSLPEMKAIQSYFAAQHRQPTDVELETLAQTWSEHCVHKTLKSAVDIEVRDSTGKVLSTRDYKNLIKETIFQSTQELMNPNPPSILHPPSSPFCLSVFVDNAGVIAFDETDAVCFKVETHNHPSAIEPYGGSATGAGGVIRDILGTGLGAKPIANTDIFCVALPHLAPGEHTGGKPPTTHPRTLPKGIIDPQRVLQQVVAGVRDYGNRMGIPTVNGAVYFDDRYLGNPLVFCGCIGLIPRNKLVKQANPGDAIVVMGGRTGRDGIHGATFSSAELTDTHADEFSHAVQIGNAITEKTVADIIHQARDQNLFTAITDCGAGGLSSAVGEMAEHTGATVHLDKVPLKYAGLRYDEIWISEAQERMVLSVPQKNVTQLLTLCQSENVEATNIGTFGTQNHELILNHQNKEVARLSMHFLHTGLPKTTRKATIIEPSPIPQSAIRNPQYPHSPDHHSSFTVHRSFSSNLISLLSHPNIASKHWIIRQYDHEVQGGSVIKPLVGPQQIGPSDAAVLRPKLTSFRGISTACGLAPHIQDPYQMVIASIDEAIRNIICVGTDYNQIAILDNFCWPSVDDELTMGTLVRACEACRDAARAYGIPFISGKDSLHNQFTNSETGEILKIPSTLLISAIGIVPDVRKCISMDFKKPGAPVFLVTTKDPTNLKSLAATHRALANFIVAGHVAAAHDISEGGLAVTAAEMAIASGFGITLDPDLLHIHPPFVETPGQYLIELRESAIELAHTKNFTAHFPDTAELHLLGHVQKDPRLMIFNQQMAAAQQKVADILTIKELTTAWRRTLDW